MDKGAFKWTIFTYDAGHGANPNCISQRCVAGSDKLSSLKRYEYSGKPIVNANGQPMLPLYMIQCNLLMGSPEISILTGFVVIKSLPFSCIIGLQILRRFSSWEILNENKLLTINKKHV